MSQTVAVVGPCGAGKSSIVKAFSAISGVFSMEESVTTTESCFESYEKLDIAEIQKEFILSPTRITIPSDTHTVIRDRIEIEAAEVFLPMHLTLGGITAEQNKELHQLVEHVSQTVATPSALLLVNAPKDILLARITGSRPPWLVESFDYQLELYEKMFRRLSGPAVLIDTSIIPEKSYTKIAEWLLQTLADVTQRNTLPSNEQFGLQWTILHAQ